MKGYFWAVLDLAVLSALSGPFLAVSFLFCHKELLNNFSKSHPNLTLIEKYDTSVTKNFKTKTSNSLFKKSAHLLLKS